MRRLLTTDPAEAVRALRAGGLVALPTETVYGLAARADSAAAVARIYRVKGRPTSHPVIVHLADAEDARRWARDMPKWTRPLTDRYWPGPLTLILRRGDQVGNFLTGGQDTVGLRVPAHPLTRAVLLDLGLAVAAPSANRFGHVSPTTAQHVLDELGEHLDPLRDRLLGGGPCQVGVESTIVDATGDRPWLLRPGALSADAIEAAIGRPLHHAGSAGVRAPGTLAAHYAPRARVVLASPQEVLAVTRRVLARHPDGRIGLISLTGAGGPPDPSVRPLLTCDTDVELAHGLYAALRAADDQDMAAVIAVLPPDRGVGAAVCDRLRKAAAGRQASAT